MSESKPPNESKAPHQAVDARAEAGVTVPEGNWSDVERLLAALPFSDWETSRRHLANITANISPALIAALPALLSESPDPDSALMLFERLVSTPEIPRLLDRHKSLAHYALVVFGHSRFLGETLIQNTDLLQSFLRDKNLDRSSSREEFHESLARFRSRSFENDVSLILARFKRREYIRIMLRDVLKIAPLAETTAEISALSDVLIEDALREAENRLLHRYEPPQRLDSANRVVDVPFAILSLGKLGGNELNYSSDVDLLYIFGDGQEPAGRDISNREYFIRLAQQVTEILSANTIEGPVFRIDLRLRPLGNEGELAIGLPQALRYYAEAAHDWERQALIKIRYSGGNIALAREFIRGVQPHVYTPHANFAAIKTALVAREKMHRRRPQKRSLEPGKSIDIKIDLGGIRDVEFLVQCLQRVYGGEEAWLRSGGTLFSLQKLHDKRHVSSKEFHDLTNAYEFLRHLEHRLQLRQGQQTHRLPLSGDQLMVLQRCMAGYAAGEYDLGDLVATVRGRMAAVAEIYQRIIYNQQIRRPRLTQEAEFQLQGTVEPNVADQSSQQILERLAADAPAIYETAQHSALSPQGRKVMLKFLSSAFTSSERYATVLRHSAAFTRALALFECSDYLSDLLVRHPEVIATLSEWQETPSRLGMGKLFEKVLGLAPAASDPMVDYLSSSPLSYGDKLTLLRQHYRRRVFASGARDIIEFRPVYESLAATTSAAEDAVSAALAVAGSPPIAVIALGRLGTGEFDVLSDADLLFVCEEAKDLSILAKPVAQLIQALSAYTQDGMVFPVDPRLRPRGADGELLVTPTTLATYCEQNAQAWEALMYTKLRFVAGSRELSELAKQSVRKLFERFAQSPDFAPQVREMRTRMEPIPPEKNFKTSKGGIYDIDFLVCYLLAKHSMQEKAGTIRDRIWRCAGAGLLDNADAAVLDHASEFLRTYDHMVRLVMGRSHKWLPPTEHARWAAEDLTGKILNRQFTDGFEAELEETFTTIRRIFDRLI